MPSLRRRVAVLAPRPDEATMGGAERFYVALRDTLQRQGLSAEIVEIPAPEHNFNQILENYIRCYELDLSGFWGIISTKAPTHACRHPNHVCYLQHQIRVFYDMFDRMYGSQGDVFEAQRATITKLDNLIFASGSPKKIFTISTEVSDRLRRYNDVESEVLYQGLSMPPADAGPRPLRKPFVLFVSRLHAWKRPALALEAMRHVASGARLLVVGTGPEEHALRTILADDGSLGARIEFLGRIPDDRLAQLYLTATAVLFCPIAEDFGLVTLEAFRHATPVITTGDSGEAARIVARYNAGLVLEPNPEVIARGIDMLVDRPSTVLSMGQRGLDALKDFDWNAAGARLAAALMDREEAALLPPEWSAHRV